VSDAAASYFADAQISTPLIDVTVRMLMDTPLPVVLETHRTLTRADLRVELAQLTLPVTVIHGTVNTSAPIDATGPPTAELVPSANLVVIDGARHGMYHAHTEQHNQALLTAIDTHPATAR